MTNLQLWYTFSSGSGLANFLTKAGCTLSLFYFCFRAWLLFRDLFFTMTSANFSADVHRKIHIGLRPNRHTCITEFSHTVSVAYILMEVHFLKHENLHRYLRKFTSARVKIYDSPYTKSLPVYPVQLFQRSPKYQLSTVNNNFLLINEKVTLICAR